MNPGLKNLSAMEYPGRILLIGMDKKGGKAVVVYAITGRSPSSQARRLEWRENGIWVRPTDEDVLKKGSVDLLIYPAVLYSAQGIAVSNGKQTEDIRRSMATDSSPLTILSTSLSIWEYEPDAPIFTPRISGCVIPGPKAAVGIIKKGAGGSAHRDYFELRLVPGKGHLISTYDGVNRDPLRSFPGGPLAVDIELSEPGELAEAVYEALKPSEPAKDFRVAVACVFAGDIAQNTYDISIINRQERK